MRSTVRTPAAGYDFGIQADTVIPAAALRPGETLTVRTISAEPVTIELEACAVR